MSNTNAHIALVSQIPVDQEAPANHSIKKFLLEKMRIIFKNKQTIRAAAIRKKKDKILEAYQKSVGFGSKIKQIKSLREKLDKAESELVELGLNESGSLLEISVHYDGPFQKPHIRWGQSWLTVTQDVYENVKEVKELMNAVEGETEPFSVFDQLETRMMMSSKVGELMAIINAVAGEAVFEVKQDLLLTNGSAV